MIILQVLQEVEALPDFAPNYSVVNQQYFLSEEKEKVEKLKSELDFHFKANDMFNYSVVAVEV